jgi:hypothetical protein
MTRRRALSVDQIKRARAMYIAGRVGYTTIAKAIGSKPSTVRDALNCVTQYAARVR